MNAKANLMFSHNWNNKLNNTVFTVIVKSSQLYKAGEIVDIYLKESATNTVFPPSYNLIGKGEILEKITTLAGQLSEYTCMMNYGTNKGECLKMLQKFYRVSSENIETLAVDILLVKNLKNK